MKTNLNGTLIATELMRNYLEECEKAFVSKHDVMNVFINTLMKSILWSTSTDAYNKILDEFGSEIDILITKWEKWQDQNAKKEEKENA